MARTRLTNPQPIITLQFNPYQQGFLEARRVRRCPLACVFEPADQDDRLGQRFEWSMLESLACPKCGAPGQRKYRRFYLRAGRRGGKTRVGALSAIEELTVPGSLGWACAPSFAELEDYVMRSFFDQLPTEWFDNPLTEWSEDRYELRMPNGAQVHFRSLDDPNRATGPGLDWIWIDEGRKIQELAWHIARPALIDKKGIALVTSSPDWGEDWCHRQFFRPAELGRPGFWAVQYRTIDNPSIDPEEVENDRVTMPPELFRREYEASIEYPTGTIYGAVLRSCEASDAEIREWIPEWPRVDPGRPSIVGLDPGTDHPFAAVLLIVTVAGIVAAGEYCESPRKYNEHAMAIKGLLTFDGALTPRWAIDRSQPQASIELSQYGIYPQGAENDVDAGIQRVYAWLASGRFRIASGRCPQLLQQMAAYRWADLKVTARGLAQDAVPYKVKDDLPDALRYALMLWPELPTLAANPSGVARARNLALLSPEHLRQITRNATPDDDDGKHNLVRVTDAPAPMYDDLQLAAEGMGEFFG